MKRTVIFCMMLISITAHALAAPVTLMREYNYLAGDADSKLSSRSIALEQVKRLLLEELGTYLISNTIVKDAQLSKDEIITYTAGAVVTVILEEKWDGSTYHLKAKLTADPDDVARSLALIKNDQERASELEQLRRQSNDSMKEIERLRKELVLAKKAPPSATSQDRSATIRRQFDEKTGELAAKEHLERGIALRNSKKFDQAAEAYTKAIELAPQWSRPYAGRGLCYLRTKNYAIADKDLEHALKLDPNNMFALSFHGVSLFQQGKKSAGILEIEKAVETAPGDILTNTNMGWALLRTNQPRKAIPFMTRAIELSHHKNGRVFRYRAEAYRQLGEKDKAGNDARMAETLGEASSDDKSRPLQQERP